ncbi:MAG: FMN-binding protein [Colwellia sp.]|nr:FMN-binding protein [Colwellia sp.]
MKTNIIKLVFIASFFLMFLPHGFAKGVYQTTEQFISQVIGEVPKAKVLWLNAQDKLEIADILSHSFNRLRIRYWQTDEDTVWVLDEIGKEKPITIGVHIQNNQIVKLKVLTFRESRGDEVRHEFFTKQFNLAKLTQDNRLTTHIDGITGATLSVRALTKVARLSLWLNNKALH